MAGPLRAGTLEFHGRRYHCADLEQAMGGPLVRLPFVLRVLLENVARCGGEVSASIPDGMDIMFRL